MQGSNHCCWVSCLIGTISCSHQPFHDGGCYHIETSPIICSTNQWTGFHMVRNSVRKELKFLLVSYFLNKKRKSGVPCAIVVDLQLTLYRPMFPSYRNQSVDLRCKSTDWFLYDGSIGR